MTLDIVNVSDLELDFENPRFFHLSLTGRKLKTQKDLEDEIISDDEIKSLLKSIKKNGVIDPIWIRKKDDGKFLVLEGNRRTVILRKLLRESVIPPKGINYDKVKALIISSSTSKQEELLQKARLQTGKRVWGPFNEAYITFKLRDKYLMELKDIAIDLQIAVSDVKNRIENYLIFIEYVKFTKDDNPKKFAFFTDAPAKVRKWFEDSEENKKLYFELITSKKGLQKIRSVSTKGGLRDFAKIIDSPQALRYLINDQNATVETALDIVKENDLTKEIPFITKFSPLAIQLMGLNESQIIKLEKENKYRNAVKQMRKACDYILKQMEDE